jgi:two-component system response regulator
MSGVKIHILLVEDNPDHAELLRRELESSPLACQLHHVMDGEAARDYVFARDRYSDRARFPAPDLLLLDLRLPRLDGMEVLRLVRSGEATRTLPVVVLTTSDAERDVAAALAAGADGFLTKPADGAALVRTIMRLRPGHAGHPAERADRPADPARV